MAVMNSYLRYFVIYNSLDSNVNLVYQRWDMELIGRFYNRGIYVEGNREKAEAVALWAVTEYSGNNMRINWLSALLEQILLWRFGGCMFHYVWVLHCLWLRCGLQDGLFGVLKMNGIQSVIARGFREKKLQLILRAATT